MQRPTSVTVISWILIVIGVLNLVTTTVNLDNPLVREMMAQSPLPIPVQLAFAYVGLTVILACGIAMLNGQNWGRWLYVIWNIIGMVVGLATSPMKALMLPGFAVFLLIAFFLFRPNATAYFTQSGASDGKSV